MDNDWTLCKGCARVILVDHVDTLGMCCFCAKPSVITPASTGTQKKEAEK